MHSLDRVLSDIGLSEKEIHIYKTLVETGHQKANTLARRVGMQRANIYYHLEGLKEKGLVSTYTEETDTTFFKAEPVEKLIELENQKIISHENIKKKIQLVLPELEAMQQKNRIPTPKVRFYDTIKGIRSLYHEIHEHTELSTIFNIDKVSIHFPEYGTTYPGSTQEKINKARDLVVYSETSPLGQQFIDSVDQVHHQAKFLNKEHQHNNDILIFGNSIAFISFSHQVTAYVIEDEEIVKAHQQIFNSLWETS
jgi:sugar-specific transcriptional regulator TrmB